MEHLDGLILHVQAAPDEDNEELASWTRQLQTHLLNLDVDSVDPVPEAEDLPGEKGLGAVIGWLAVRIGTAETLKSVVEAVAGWATRTGHSVKVSYNGDVLEVGRATRAQQERIISHFIANHTPAP